MNLEDSISFRVVTPDGFGDPDPSDKYVTPTSVEQAASFVRGLNAELETGELIAWIAPDSNVYADNGLEMVGMLAEYQGTMYRVARVVPGGSLLTGDPDLVELTLTKVDQEDGE
jgi:hypothetical protein